MIYYQHPKSYHRISGFLLEKSKEIRSGGVSQAFFPKTVLARAEGGEAVVEGRRTRVVGNVVTDDREVAYRIRFELGARNRPLVTELAEEEGGAGDGGGL